MRNDSVHGAFRGTIRVNKQNNSLIINGNEVSFIYSDNPKKVKYKDFDIKRATVIDSTGVWRDEEGLSQHVKNPSVERVFINCSGERKN